MFMPKIFYRRIYMKKFVIFLVLALIVAVSGVVIGCKKISPDAAATATVSVPSITPTQTPYLTKTITPSFTATCSSTDTPVCSPTITSTNTPVIRIQAYIYGPVNNYFNVLVSADSTPVADATVTVNGVLSNAFASNSYNGAFVYIPGDTCTVAITTNNTTYTDSVIEPGGNIDFSDPVVTWTYEGNKDYLFIRDSSSVIVYRTDDTVIDIDSGFSIPSGAYVTGTNHINMYAKNFKGPAFLPAQNSFLSIETSGTFSVTK